MKTTEEGENGIEQTGRMSKEIDEEMTKILVQRSSRL